MIDLGIGNLRIKKAGRSGIYALFKGEDLVTPLTNLEEHLASMVEELEQRLAEAEELKADFKKAMKLFEDTGLDNLLWTLLDTITKGE